MERIRVNSTGGLAGTFVLREKSSVGDGGFSPSLALITARICWDREDALGGYEGARGRWPGVGRGSSEDTQELMELSRAGSGHPHRQGRSRRETTDLTSH